MSGAREPVTTAAPSLDIGVVGSLLAAGSHEADASLSWKQGVLRMMEGDDRTMVDDSMTLETLETLEREQEQLVLDSFDFEDAWALGLRLRQNASKSAYALGIEVTHGNDIVFATLLPGASANFRRWITRKREVVRHFQRSSLFMRLTVEHEGFDFEKEFRLPPHKFAARGGGVPIIVRGVGLVGVATASGLPDLDDHRFVVDGIKTLL